MITTIDGTFQTRKIDDVQSRPSREQQWLPFIIAQLKHTINATTFHGQTSRCHFILMSFDASEFQ